jgi:hypothetical protein
MTKREFIDEMVASLNNALCESNWYVTYGPTQQDPLDMRITLSPKYGYSEAFGYVGGFELKPIVIEINEQKE